MIIISYVSSVFFCAAPSPISSRSVDSKYWCPSVRVDDRLSPSQVFLPRLSNRAHGYLLGVHAMSLFFGCGWAGLRTLLRLRADPTNLWEAVRQVFIRIWRSLARDPYVTKLIRRSILRCYASGCTFIPGEHRSIIRDTSSLWRLKSLMINRVIRERVPQLHYFPRYYGDELSGWFLL